MESRKKLVIGLASLMIILLSLFFASISGASLTKATNISTTEPVFTSLETNLLNSEGLSFITKPLSTIAGSISAVQVDTSSTSSWSIGPSPDPVGTTIKVDIRIDGASPQTIWGWTVKVNWDASVLQLTKVKEGNFLKDSGDNTMMIGSSSAQWDNDAGSILGGLSCADSDFMTPQTTLTSGVLATLTFNVVDYGSASVTLSDANLRARSDDTTGSFASVTNALITVIAPGSSSSNHAVVFHESGLASGTTWSVTCNGQTLSSSGADVTFSLASGSYSYSVSSVSGYSSSPASGTVTVSNADQTVTITFSSSSSSNHFVIFHESGLASGITWSVTCNGQSLSSSGTDISFSLASGSYSYSVGSVSGYSVSPSSGTVTVGSADQTMTLTFSSSSSSNHAVVFHESGLASGTTWSVTCNGQTLSSSGADVTFSLASGSYSYSVSSVSGYSSSPASGTVTVSNADQTITVTFTATSTNGARIDVFTGKGGAGSAAGSPPYGPQELIRMYALVTYNNAPVANLDVTFSVKNSAGDAIALRLGRTNSSGYAVADYRLPWPDTSNPEGIFGTWSIVASVSVSQVTVSDTVQFVYNYVVNLASNNGVQLPASVHRQSTLNLVVTIESIANPAVTSTLVVTVYDEAKVPIGSYVTTNTYGSGGSSSVSVAIKIPSWAFIGTATVYADILTNTPSAGGVSRCPEKVATFQIVA